MLQYLLQDLLNYNTPVYFETRILFIPTEVSSVLETLYLQYVSVCFYHLIQVNAYFILEVSGSATPQVYLCLIVKL